MKDYDLEKIFVIINDNAANMREAFTLINEKYPNIVPLGCLSHFLHLLCTGILQCKSIQNFLTNSIEIVKMIKCSDLLQPTFTRIQKQEIKKNIAISLKLAVKTRCGSYLCCLLSLKEAVITNKKNKQTAKRSCYVFIKLCITNPVS